MKVVRLKENEDGNYTDGNIFITGFHIWLNTTTVRNQKNRNVDVPDSLSCHCTVTNTGRFLSKLTLIITSVDDDNYNFGSITDSVLCLDYGEKWEFYGMNDDLGFYDPDDGTTGNPSFSRIRGEDVNNYCDDGWSVKVYAIEEFNDEDYTGGLGTTE